MNGIERITARIAEDAKKENDAALEQAQREADGIVAGYKKQADDRVAAMLPKARANARENTERRLATAAMESRKLDLAARQRVIAKAFDAAEDALVKLPAAKKTEWLAGLAAKASRTGSERVALSAADHAAIGKKVVTAANKLLGAGGKLTLAEAPRGISGGLILSDGDIEVNCSAGALMDAARDGMSREVGDILFS
ncbi:MAG: V-type ATP synthase subunit E family protein [Oscillospiraceae bacterium]|nr:V-type ATP synthase subunit E family protein [Oscillospiraceae bacterium]